MQITNRIRHSKAIGWAILLMLLMTYEKEAYAQNFTALQLKQMCEQEEPPVSCLAFFLGYTGAVSGINYQNSNPKIKWIPLYCPPKGVVVEQYRQIFLKWATAKPEMLHLEAVEAAGLAFMDTFPCNYDNLKN